MLDSMEFLVANLDIHQAQQILVYSTKSGSVWQQR